MRRLLPALLLPLLVVACSDEKASDNVIETTTSTSTTTRPDSSSSSTSTTGATTTTAAPFDGSTARTSVPEEGYGQLTDVRVGAEGGVERVVFEFRETRPGAQVAYVEPPITQDGSGQPIDVDGEAFLQVVMMPATGFDFDTGTESYTGPDRVTGGTTLVREVVRTGDFEGYLTWVIGLDREVAYRVLTLDGARLVIELDAA